MVWQWLYLLGKNKGRLVLNLRKTLQNGVTLIELMIGISIMAILLAAGLPSFQTWIQNTQIRTSTESVQNGLQLARAEAVRRNEQISFILGTGTSWTVQTVSAGTVPAGTVLQSGLSSEGSVNVTPTVTPTGATTATFDPLGRLTNPSTAPTQIEMKIPSMPTNVGRPLRIVISSYGLVRTCDPYFTAAGDPRKC